MKIEKAFNENEYKDIDTFFGKIWNELFSIKAYNQIKNYQKCDIYFIKNNSKIISAIVYMKNKDGKKYIWRFGTLKEFRGKGYGTKLINYVLKKHLGDINLHSDIKQVDFYKNFGFIETGEKKDIGNSIGIGMIRKI